MYMCVCTYIGTYVHIVWCTVRTVYVCWAVQDNSLSVKLIRTYMHTYNMVYCTYSIWSFGSPIYTSSAEGVTLNNTIQYNVWLYRTVACL